MNIIKDKNKNLNKKIILYVILSIIFIFIITAVCLKLAKDRKINIGDVIENYAISYELVNDEGEEFFKVVSINKNELSTDIVIPKSLFGIPVKSIDSLVFDNCTSLKSIVIPESVISIGNGAFNKCTSLKKITIPFVGEKADGSAATHFGYIFGAADYLENETKVPFSLKEVVITNAVSIAPKAFYNCYGITDVVISSNLSHIGFSAFEMCRAIEKITIPFVGEKADGSGALHFGYIFGSSDYLSNSGYVPSSLKEVIITTATSIGDNAFYNCGLIKSIILPNTIFEIGKFSFYYCESLQNIIIPNSVESIGERAFGICTSLTEIIVPDSVNSVGCAAFDRCKSLKKITIPFVGERADGSGATYFGYIFDYSGVKSNVLVPQSLKEVVITKETKIRNYAFYDCTKIESIIIPNSVKSIGESAFYNCTSLKKIIIPISVTQMGKNVFSYSPELTIYCEVKVKPTQWISWSSGCTVVWGYSNN